MMRHFAVLVLLLFLFANQPVEAQDSETSLVLPEVQWDKDVGIGFISTAPLVTEGLVIVKGGGSNSDGIAPTMVAYRADNGSEVWRATHSVSTYNFEMSPIVQVPAGILPCSPVNDLVVTGWTSGQLTAHDLATGAPIWNVSTPAPLWGITAQGLNIEDRIIWPTETGIIDVCAANGTLQHQHQNNSIRTYRANIGLWYSWNNFTMDYGYLQGTESGDILRYDVNLTLVGQLNVAEVSNFSGDWKIRTTPVMYQYTVSPDYPMIGLLTHIQGDGESRFVRIDWNESSSPVLIEYHSLGAGSATTLAGGSSSTPVAMSDGVVEFEMNNNGTLDAVVRWDAKDISGEIRPIQVGTEDGYCFPQNRAQGSWYIATDSGSTTWAPQHSGWVTAGCGSDLYVLAAANDASWLEVRFDLEDFNTIRTNADKTLGIESETIVTDEPEIEQSDSENQESSTTEGTYGIIFLPFIGAAFLAGLSYFAQQSDVRRQIQIGALFFVILGLLMAGSIYNANIVGEPVEDSSDRLRISSVIPDLESGLNSNEVLVTIHFPESYAPEHCSQGEVRLYETGEAWLLSPAPQNSYCVLVAMIPVESGDTIEDVTRQSIDEFGLNYEIEQMTLGAFLQTIGNAEGGSDNHWWTYDLNGGYGTIGMAEQVVEPGDEIGWFFEDSEY
ncbi:MAG: hypothetical protein CMB26_05670 [Euryarchaeota archaeon]|nr:hypothetical protein [Euryarchaeota archaeon]|tara:strand:- start:6255 stop:8258 length:2004 start_codon:yes stop_codon:yes gene_type:complete